MATKFDQRFGVLLIQLSATVESDHANTESIFKIEFSVARMTPHSVEPSRAAQSSSLGTEMVLIGATRVLEQSMWEWKPSEFFETMYATLAYADSGASQKMCNSAASKFSQMRRGIFRIFKSQRFAKNQPRFYQRFGKQIVPIEF